MTDEQIDIVNSPTTNSGDASEVRLKHLAKINPTKSEVSNLNPETKVSFVPLEDFGTSGGINSSEVKKLEEVYDGYTYFREGDLAIAKITPSFENGKGAICENLENGIGFGTTELHILRPREGIDTEFLWYILRSKRFRDGAKAAMKGVAGQKRVPSNFIENFKVPALNIDKQKEISKYLSKKDDIIRGIIERALEVQEQIESKRLSEISNRITYEQDRSRDTKDSNIPWLGQVPIEWNVAKAGWYFDVQLGKKLDSSEVEGDNLYPYLRNQDVSWWEINTEDLAEMDFFEKEREKFELKNGDVLVCEGGHGYGESAVWREEDTDIYYQMALHRVRPYNSDFSSDFFCYFMEFAIKNGIFSASSNQSTIEHITTEKIKNQEMPLPPIEEQVEIANSLHDMTETMQRTISKLDELIALLEEKRLSEITRYCLD